MIIEKYREGQSLHLAPEDGEVAPVSKVGISLFATVFFGVLLLLPSWLPELFAPDARKVWYGFFAVAGALMVYLIATSTRTRLIGLQVEGDSQQLVVELLRGNQRESIRCGFEDLKEWSLQSYKSTTGSASQRQVSFVLKLWPKERQEIEAEGVIQELDSPDELLDFGSRLADIFGSSGEITQNDAMELVIHYSQPLASVADASRPRRASRPVQDAKALAALYASDTLELEELQQVVTEDWKPEGFDGHAFDGEIVEHRPGAHLIYHFGRQKVRRQGSLPKRLSEGFKEASAVGFMVALVLSFFLLLFQALTSSDPVLSGSTVALLIGGIFVATMGISLPFAVRYTLEPVRWRWDWKQGQLRYQRAQQTRTVDTDDITEVILVLDRKSPSKTTGHGNSRTRTSSTYYFASIQVALKDRQPLEVGHTGMLEADPQRAFQSAMAFAGLLTNALKVPLRFENLTGLSEF